MSISMKNEEREIVVSSILFFLDSEEKLSFDNLIGGNLTPKKLSSLLKEMQDDEGYIEGAIFDNNYSVDLKGVRVTELGKNFYNNILGYEKIYKNDDDNKKSLLNKLWPKNFMIRLLIGITICYIWYKFILLFISSDYFMQNANNENFLTIIFLSFVAIGILFISYILGTFSIGDFTNYNLYNKLDKPQKKNKIHK